MFLFLWMDLFATFSQLTLQKSMYEALKLQALFLHGSKKPIWKWEEIENKSKRGNKQTQSVVHFYEDGSVGISFNICVIEENQKAKLLFLQLWHCSFLLIQIK